MQNQTKNLNLKYFKIFSGCQLKSGVQERNRHLLKIQNSKKKKKGFHSYDSKETLTLYNTHSAANFRKKLVRSFKFL